MTIEPYIYIDEPSGRVDTLAMALDKCDRLERRLEIALRGLNFIIAQSYGKDMWDCAKDTLKQIKELEK